MAKSTPRDRRLRFFALGNTHCPICLAPFTEPGVRTGDGATLEHAPPKAVGGREVCLTCRSCNALASATSDQAIKRTRAPPEVTIDVHGRKRTARFWADGIPPERMPYRFADTPAGKEAERALGGEAVLAVTQPIAFEEATTIKEVVMTHRAANAWHLKTSYLRSAYLLVFSLLGAVGYVYARSEALRQVREQILNPDHDVAGSLLRSVAIGKRSGTVITLRSNARPFFWSVRFDDGACVLLPHGGGEERYREVAGLSQHERIRGWEWQPQKFGRMPVDRGRLMRRAAPSGADLFGREYVTVSNGEREQRWVVVNEAGDGMRAGPVIHRRATT